MKSQKYKNNAIYNITSKIIYQKKSVQFVAIRKTWNIIRSQEQPTNSNSNIDSDSNINLSYFRMNFWFYFFDISIISQNDLTEDTVFIFKWVN